uniref:BTB domain-containing protein n=1 Tax=Caenorhabditis japonica TaxID=281687 RepID=A0A8R1DS28_CAEJA
MPLRTFPFPGRLLDLINKPVPDSNADAYFSPTSEFYFERPPSLFHIVYQFYLNGVIHQPSNLCPVDIIEELEFWRIIPDEYLASCCCAQQLEDDEEELEEQDKPNLFKTLKFGHIRRTIWNIIEEPASSGKAQLFAIFSVFFVLISISGLVLGSLPELQVATKRRNNLTEEEFVEMEPLPILGYIEYACIVWFTMEYGLKMLVSAERSRTFRQLLNIIDLLAILPFIIEMLLLIFGISTEQLRDLKGAFLVIRILRVLRVIRVLKLGRYSSGLQMFGKTLKASFRQLGMMAMVVMTGVIFFSTLVYFLEKDEPGSKFHSIPAACWWCIVTMTTVGKLIDIVS